MFFDTQKSGKCKTIYRFFVKYLAEREGFEPSVRLPVQRFSRPSRSTTPASFLKPSAKLRLFSEKHHFYPIFFQSKSRESGKKSAFHLEYQPPTNSHKADSFSLTDVSSGKIQNQHQSDFWRVILQKKGPHHSDAVLPVMSS